MHSTLRYDLYEALSNQEPDPPRISCMMVTKNRVEQAKLAIQCFQNQTYPNKELIIVDDDISDRLAQHVNQLADPDIHHWHLEPENKTLGELRNLALSQTSGFYVCQWDDDDLADPMRLEMQMIALQSCGADACFLQRWLMWWVDRRRMAISRSRIWEGSMLCRKDKLSLHPTDANYPTYPAERFGEDTPVVTHILQTCRVALLDQPELYTYVIHQKNTFNDAHFEQHWQQASSRYEGIYHEELVQRLAQRIPINAYRNVLGIAPLPLPDIVQPQLTESESQSNTSTDSSQRVESPAKANPEPAIGINVTGHIDAEIGLGESARATLRSLEAAQISIVINNLHLVAKHPDTTYRNFSKDNPYPINLVHTNPDVLTSWMAAKTLYHWVKPDYFNDRYNVGYWVWETPTLPEEWQPVFNVFSEIWTPSSFSADAIAKVSPVPVIKIPHSIALPAPVSNRVALNLPDDKFIFLFIFHPESGYDRKNPEAVIQAFKQAFGTVRQDVLLILKTKDLSNTAIAQLQALTENSTSIQIINESFTRDQINGLLLSCDCYVSLHRAEGFGLTIAEAMFYGKPAIATAYSGNTDYMTINNSYLVNYELTTLEQDVPPYQKGSQWADPDIDHAAELMRYVFEHQEHAKQVGARAAKDIQSQFSPEAIGKLIQERLEWLVKSDRLQSGRQRQVLAPAKPSPQPETQPSSAQIVRERIVLDPVNLPTVLILTPVKNAVEFLPKYLDNILDLSYPHEKISLGFLESDSSDGTFDWLQENLSKIRQKFRQIHLFRRDFHFNHYPLPRWEFRIQFNRRSVLAKSRNLLLHQALRDEDWVLWLDVDVSEYPIDVIQQLLQTGRDVVVPNCVVEPGGKTFDLNTFKFKPGAESQDWTPYRIDGIILPPAEGMMYLQDLRDQEIVEVDGVGGTMLLIKADLHREGLTFPTFSYNSYIETNGLAMMAKDMGYTCWGLPQLEIIHR